MAPNPIPRIAHRRRHRSQHPTPRPSTGTALYWSCRSATTILCSMGTHRRSCSVRNARRVLYRLAEGRGQQKEKIEKRSSFFSVIPIVSLLFRSPPGRGRHRLRKITNRQARCRRVCIAVSDVQVAQGDVHRREVRTATFNEHELTVRIVVVDDVKLMEVVVQSCILKYHSVQSPVSRSSGSTITKPRLSAVQ